MQEAQGNIEGGENDLHWFPVTENSDGQQTSPADRAICGYMYLQIKTNINNKMHKIFSNVNKFIISHLMCYINF